jgi:hypothetical protein
MQKTTEFEATIKVDVFVGFDDEGSALWECRDFHKNSIEALRHIIIPKESQLQYAIDVDSDRIAVGMFDWDTRAIRLPHVDHKDEDEELDYHRYEASLNLAYEQILLADSVGVQGMSAPHYVREWHEKMCPTSEGFFDTHEPKVQPDEPIPYDNWPDNPNYSRVNLDESVLLACRILASAESLASEL